MEKQYLTCPADGLKFMDGPVGPRASSSWWSSSIHDCVVLVVEAESEDAIRGHTRGRSVARDALRGRDDRPVDDPVLLDGPVKSQRGGAPGPARLSSPPRAGSAANDVVEAARSMVCLHGTDPATVYLSAWARVDGMTVADLERSLYVERSLVKHLAMRRTLFVLPRETMGVAQAGASNPSPPPIGPG